MNGPGLRTGKRDGFSSLELLLVLALTASLFAGLAAVLPRPSGSASLAAAQALVSSQLAAGRLEAIRTGSPVRWVIARRPHSSAAADLLGTALPPAGPGLPWRLSGAAAQLPPGVTVVVAADAVFNPDWPADLISRLTPLESGAIEGISGESWCLQFSARGQVPGTPQVVLALFAEVAGAPHWHSPERVRGVVVRSSGRLVPVREREGF